LPSLSFIMNNMFSLLTSKKLKSLMEKYQASQSDFENINITKPK
jgi:hypothetical protein